MQQDGIGGKGLISGGYDAAPPRLGPDPTHELRIALAMRGGVSLAVWIGGAVTEIERLRQHARPGNDVYRKLLEINGYRDVVVDVLSGASAGGLNGVVYAAAQAHGFEMGALRDLWLRLGDIELLARATTAGGRAESAAEAGARIARNESLRPPSLLRGDEYFYTSVREALTDQIVLAASAGTTDRAERLDLVLSATLFEPKRVKKLVNRTTVVEDNRSNALFRFRHHPDEGRDLTDADHTPRLAMAARTTSSFPFAFEPARIGIGEAGAAGATAGLDFSGVFEVPRTADDQGVHEVIDGGVLDNIPVAAAIDAVVAAPADGPTDRWLCYLHPSPSSEDPAAADDEADPAQPLSRRGVAAVLRTFGARFNQESLLQDIDELQLVNDVALRRDALRESLLAPYGLGGTSELVAEVNGAEKTRDLQEMLAQFEANRIRGNLERPDRLGITSGVPHVASWPPWLQTEVGERLTAVEVANADDRRASRTITGQLDAIGLLIAYARQVENAGLEADLESAGEIKQALYAQRRTLDALVRDEAVLWGARLLEAFADPTSVTPDEVDDHIVATCAESTAASADALSSSWQSLVEAAEALTQSSTAVGAPFSLLRGAAEGEVAPALEALVLLLLPVRLLGRGPWKPLRFVYVNGDAPASREFSALWSGDRAPTSKDKLAGNELANFSAFLSARWRANDWMWGRLDAASTLVDEFCGPHVLGDGERRERLAELVADPAVTAASTDAEIVEGVRARVQRDIFASEAPTVARTPAGEIDAAPPADELTIADYDIGKDTLGDLGEGRRTRIGMRMAHLAFAALRPDGGTVKARVTRATSSILKPVYLIAAFMYLAPARGFLALALGTSGVQATFWRARDEASFTFDVWTSLMVASGAIGLALAGLAKMRHRAADDPWVSTSSALGVGSLVIAGVLAVRETGPAYVTLLVTNLGIFTLSVISLVSRLRRSSADAEAVRRSDANSASHQKTILAWALAGLVALTGIVIGWADPFWSGTADWSDVDELVYLLVPVGVTSTFLGSSWMRLGAVVSAMLLTLCVGFGSLSITEHRGEDPLLVDTRLWAWIAVGLLVSVYFADRIRMLRHLGFDHERPRSSLLPGALLWAGGLSALAFVATTRDVTVSMGAWASISVGAASYANVALATYLPVFQPARPLVIDAGGPPPSASARATHSP